MGIVSTMPMTTEMTMPMMKGCCKVAHSMMAPRDFAAVPMGSAISRARPQPTTMVTRGVTSTSTLVFLLTSIPTSEAAMAMIKTASGPPAPPRELVA